MRPVTKITILGTRLGVIALVVYWILIFVGTHIPEIPDSAPKINDKVMHFCAYFGLTICLCYVSNPGVPWKRFGRIALIALTYAGIDEFTQSFVPTRTADWMDFAADTLGITTAIGFYLLAQAIVRRYLQARTKSGTI